MEIFHRFLGRTAGLSNSVEEFTSRSDIHPGSVLVLYSSGLSVATGEVGYLLTENPPITICPSRRAGGYPRCSRSRPVVPHVLEYNSAKNHCPRLTYGTSHGEKP